MRTLTPIGWAIAGAGLIALAVIVWFVLTEPGRQKTVAAQATGTAVVASAGQAAAHDAMNASETAAEAASASQAITEANHAEILSAPGADVRVGNVSDTGLRSLCKRAVYADHPRCRAMRSAGS